MKQCPNVADKASLIILHSDLPVGINQLCQTFIQSVSQSTHAVACPSHAGLGTGDPATDVIATWQCLCSWEDRTGEFASV